MVEHKGIRLSSLAQLHASFPLMVMGAAWDGWCRSRGRSRQGWRSVKPLSGLQRARALKRRGENKAKRLIIKEAFKSFPWTEGKEREHRGCWCWAQRVPQPLLHQHLARRGRGCMGEQDVFPSTAPSLQVAVA